ncbi:MobA/MobL family protein [Luteibacter sp.]|jgi:hypothetical protein|uniref:MobA/MobL family protein n=1 Tax=Luteibacter sp. TaxID=1886636 RepID=UPI002F410186
MTHARPHLTTHSRGKGHSALAGVAYRLGLRLLDKRTGEWHDYRHRALGEEVVAAFTLAPEGAPMWATDAERLWSAVERAERRKDSQVAHDYRLPVPFGLSDVEATEMARYMAQSIVERFHTIVSVGLHRDSPVDALGFPKPIGKIGFHAHVYFPTRRFECKPEPSEDGGAQGESGGSEGWSFTDKLKELSHKKAASVVIDKLNAQWADLANVHASAVGLVPDFTHLSYKRLGLAKLPQLRLGPSATAMERKGLPTRKGDSLRAALAEERMPPVAAPTQSPTTAPMEVAPVVATASEARLHDWLYPAAPIVFRQGPSAVTSRPTVAPTGLAARFLAELDEKPELPQPTPEQREQLIGWLQRIESALRALVGLAARLLDVRERRQRDDGARATFSVELHDRRRRRAEARQALAEWLDGHPWQLRMVRAMGGSGKPPVLVELEGQASSFDTEVQQLKRGVADAVERVAGFDRQMATAMDEQDVAQHELDACVQSVAALEPLYAMVLTSVADAHTTPFLTQALRTAKSVESDALDMATVSVETSPVLRLEKSNVARPSL